MMLVTLDQAKAHLRVDTDAEDEDLTLRIHAASVAVLAYLKDSALQFTEADGSPLVDSSGIVPVPYQVQVATLMLVGTLYGSRGEDGGQAAQIQMGYLPPIVTAMLYPLRDPALA